MKTSFPYLFLVSIVVVVAATLVPLYYIYKELETMTTNELLKLLKQN